MGFFRELVVLDKAMKLFSHVLRWNIRESFRSISLAQKWSEQRIDKWLLSSGQTHHQHYLLNDKQLYIIMPGVKDLKEKDRKLLSYLLNTNSCHHWFSTEAGFQISQNLFNTLGNNK